MEEIAVAVADDLVVLRSLGGASDETIDRSAAPVRLGELERAGARWVWADTRELYPELLRAGVRLERCVDLRLCHAILAASTYLAEPLQSSDTFWDRSPAELLEDEQPTLLARPMERADLDQVVAEHRLQTAAVADSPHRHRLRLLLAAESAGALIAAELHHHGLPFDVAVHDRQLTELLGPKPRFGGRPAVLEGLLGEIRTALGQPGLNPDSPPELLRALHTVGLDATSTRQWELSKLDHPAIAPLLTYKKLSRLLSANGWGWADQWVRDGRFRPEYVPAGVVTGRWATRGGGALQIPKLLRGAVTAEPGWRLVVADAAQLEPRVLAAMASDHRLARAARGGDLYQGLVDEGVVETRAKAKVAMLGALYGATTGESGQLMPRLIKAYPRATGLVEDAARAGERGEVVTTWLGRSSPRPGPWWYEGQNAASQPEAGPTEQRRARQQARDWGRFTRNFVVQGTAAEWALCWMADLRNRLATLGPPDDRPYLVYFLHDEIIVHTPDRLADQAEHSVREAAHTATRLMFGDFEIDLALDLATVTSYAETEPAADIAAELETSEESLEPVDQTGWSAQA
ncbi:bifunctional 3'-5' exonuclease/DNA polymerase [Microlunatus parietis]|uniref:DNA-directed DNA polymerase n=1 Tax=Microlunatus parietis TaxID=682979 RepID=A0A7Y9I9J2_9ACTN|nr:bifunctional 3'-5' exonuclease/DNA polymerase [Microlunatus parietis]NYE72687.1 DNA polymerase-1 [Microlunatus parietis]